MGKARDWSSVPLGLVQDAVLAKQLGCCVATVRRARKKRGIPPVRKDWARQQIAKHPGLGKLRDGEIAEELGVSRPAVSVTRKALGIPAPPRAGAWTPEQDDQLRLLWGRMSPEKIAERLGRESGVRHRAKKLGLGGVNRGFMSMREFSRVYGWDVGQVTRVLKSAGVSLSRTPKWTWWPRSGAWRAYRLSYEAAERLHARMMEATA